MPKNEVPLLTASMAANLSQLFPYTANVVPSLRVQRDALSAIASGTVVCVEAERLARMEAVLRKIADSPNAKFDLESVSTDFASGMLKAFGAAATIARAALAPTGEKP